MVSLLYTDLPLPLSDFRFPLSDLESSVVHLAVVPVDKLRIGAIPVLLG